MSNRLKPQDLTLLNSSPFMTSHGARVTYPLAQALSIPDFFMTVRSNLRAGDRVQLCRFATGDWTRARLMEFAEVIITQSAAKGVEFELTGDIRIIGAAKPELEVVKPEPERAALEVAADAQGGFLVRETASGNVHKHFKSEVAAKRYVSDYGGKEQAAQNKIVA